MALGTTGDTGDVMATSSGEQRPVQPYDFRRPDRFALPAVRSLEAAHEIFTRRLGSAWGSALRGVVQVEPAAVDQVTYDDYIRALPSPDLIVQVNLAPLPGPVIVDVNLELGLRLLDRLLGAGDVEPNGPIEPRRPTDLETSVLGSLMTGIVPALEETLGSFIEVSGTLAGIEYNPQLVQAAAPSDSVLLFSFFVRVTQGIRAEGMITLCYPAAVAVPLVDRVVSLLHTETDNGAVDETWHAAMCEELGNVDATLEVVLADTPVPAVDLAALRVGDVLRLDHRVDAPVRGRIEGHEILSAYLGRRGRRLAIQVLDPPAALAHDPLRSTA